MTAEPTVRTRKALVRRLRSVFRKDWAASTAVAARDLLAVRPENGLGWFRLGGALADMARYREAFAALRRALGLARAADRDLVHWRIAEAHDARGALRLAERHYRLAVAANPDEASWRIMLGALLARMGRLREAAAVHRRAVRCKLGPRDEAWLNLGLVLRAQERHAEARQCFRRALRLDPRDRDAKQALRDVDYVLRGVRP
ncbi:MAG TPA: tetratricopeptide repeat protein [Planctomycetota bacterium]